MVSKHLEFVKRQARDRYKRFASPSSATTPPPSRQEVGSFSCRHTAPPPSRMQEVGSSSRHHTAPPHSRMQEVGSSSRHHTTPPPSRQEESSSDDSVEIWLLLYA
jgi:hypothetical protein